MAANIDIGIEGDDRAAIADGLSRVLADSYTLYLKTHSFNWNVTGRMFNALHTMIEQQYTELAAAVDLIAERIRMLDFPHPVATRSRGRRAKRLLSPRRRMINPLRIF